MRKKNTHSSKGIYIEIGWLQYHIVFKIHRIYCIAKKKEKKSKIKITKVNKLKVWLMDLKGILPIG